MECGDAVAALAAVGRTCPAGEQHGAKAYVTGTSGRDGARPIGRARSIRPRRSILSHGMRRFFSLPRAPAIPWAGKRRLPTLRTSPRVSAKNHDPMSPCSCVVIRLERSDPMITMRRCILAVGVLIAGAAGVGLSGDVGKIPTLEAPEAKARAIAYADLVAERTERIKALLQLAERRIAAGIKEADDPGVFAIRLLGDYRAEEAVPLLARNVALLTNTNKAVFSADLWLGSRCAASLAKIGKPASRECLARLGDPGTETEVYLLSLVIRQVEGEEVARLLIDRAIAKEDDQARKARLTDIAKKYFKGKDAESR